MEKTIKLDSGKTIKLKCNAATTRLYRIWLDRDLLIDMMKYEKEISKIEKNNENPDNVPPQLITVAENLAFVMMKDAMKLKETSVEEWLNMKLFEKDTTIVYQIMKEALELWIKSTQQSTKNIKKKNQMIAKTQKLKKGK